MLWTDKYSPKNFEEVLGNKKAKDEISDWIEDWLDNKPHKPLLLVGPPGVGKTTLAHLAAQKFADYVELNASDKRSYDVLIKTIGEASATESILNQGLKLLILDEVDGIHGTDDRGGIRAISKIIKEGHHPMIMMANDPYSKRIKSLKTKCQVVTIRKVHTNSITAMLKRICSKEGVTFEEHVLRTLAKRSNGDLRSAINDLEIMARGKESITSDDLQIISQKDEVHNIFDSVRTVLKSKNPQKIRDAMRLEADPGFILELITENIPREYEKKHEIQNAYEMISQADLYLGRAFQTRNYGYWKYAYSLMSLGVALAKDDTYKKFARYTNSSVYSMLSKSRSKRELHNRVAGKIGGKIHTSTKVAKDHFPYFNIMFQDNDLAWGLANYFRLENDEVKVFRSRKIKEPKKTSKTRSKNVRKDKKSDTQKVEDKKIKNNIDNNKVSIKKQTNINNSVKKKKNSKSKDKEKQVSLFNFK